MKIYDQFIVLENTGIIFNLFICDEVHVTTVAMLHLISCRRHNCEKEVVTNDAAYYLPTVVTHIIHVHVEYLIYILYIIAIVK